MGAGFSGRRAPRFFLLGQPWESWTLGGGLGARLEVCKAVWTYSHLSEGGRGAFESLKIEEE